jgi:myosin V
MIFCCQKYELLLTSTQALSSTLHGNRLLLRRECCSCSNGQYIKAGLTQLKHWCDDVSGEVVIWLLLF